LRRPESAVIKILGERRENIFADFLMPEEMMKFLITNQSFTPHPDSYITPVFIPTPALYPQAGELLKIPFHIPSMALNLFESHIDNGEIGM
jgi:hypothetical protein